MKIEQPKKFVPIVITLESREEVDVMRACLSGQSIPTELIKAADHMFMSMDDFVVNVAVLDGEGSGDPD